jgi:peptide/nickel transport system ATP-binding protein/oligopeptide transport system ATP-binding protein
MGVMNAALLEIRDLHTYFFTARGIVKAVNGLDLKINRRETVSLVGESGCGKSVTALSIMGLIPQPPGRIVEGQILFDGKDLTEVSDEEMRRIRGNSISMIFQEPMTSLNPVFRVGAQIAEVIQLHQGLSKHAALNRAVEMLAKVGIPDPDVRIREYPYQMSGGMRQRVMIAMALACNPKMVIADEPTTALDVTIQAQTLELMSNLKEEFGTSILLITHDLGVVAEMTQFVAVMYAGEIVESTDVVELFSHPMHPYTIGLMASIPQIDAPIPADRKLEVIPGVVPSLMDLPPGCSFRERCSRAFDRCQREDPPLIDVKPGHQVRCWLYAE